MNGKLCACALLVAGCTSAWWALALFGFPQGDDVRGYMQPVLIAAIATSIGIVCWLSVEVASHWDD